MPFVNKKSFRRRIRPSPLPKNTCWIESDSYDRHAYNRICRDSTSLRSLEENGSNLLPNFGSLLQDLFCLLFKHNVIFLNKEVVLPSAQFNQTILNALQQGDLYRILREFTLLDENKTGLCTLLLGESILSMLKSEKTLNRRHMLDLWDLKKQEDITEGKREELENAEALSKTDLSARGNVNLTVLQDSLEGQFFNAETQLKRKEERWREEFQNIEKPTKNRLQAEAIKVAQQLEDAAEQAENWSHSLGTGYKSPSGHKLELGKRLAGNEKVKKLSRMVGRMKFYALALRKTVFERSSEEVLEVERGDSINRLLPYEMTTLHHPILQKDFYRRFLDKELLQYSLKGVEEKGKGPMIVCLDCSSSMAGDKEIWSKAVTLTLLEIARRQRRLFRTICFSSEDTPLQVLDLNSAQRYVIEMEKVLDLAEFFPGGGTNFQRPLDEALECLKSSQYKRGDVVFITDGECQIAPDWTKRFCDEKYKLGFSLFSILIDAGPSSLGTLKEFSDRITTVKKLTGEEAKDIFIKY